jgi:hypothetical protein
VDRYFDGGACPVGTDANCLYGGVGLTGGSTYTVYQDVSLPNGAVGVRFQCYYDDYDARDDTVVTLIALDNGGGQLGSHVGNTMSETGWVLQAAEVFDPLPQGTITIRVQISSIFDNGSRLSGSLDDLKLQAYFPSGTTGVVSPVTTAPATTAPATTAPATTAPATTAPATTAPATTAPATTAPATAPATTGPPTTNVPTTGVSTGIPTTTATTGVSTGASTGVSTGVPTSTGVATTTGKAPAAAEDTGSSGESAFPLWIIFLIVGICLCCVLVLLAAFLISRKKKSEESSSSEELQAETAGGEEAPSESSEEDPDVVVYASLAGLQEDLSSSSTEDDSESDTSGEIVYADLASIKE